MSKSKIDPLLLYKIGKHLHKFESTSDYINWKKTHPNEAYEPKKDFSNRKIKSITKSQSKKERKIAQKNNQNIKKQAIKDEKLPKITVKKVKPKSKHQIKKAQKLAQKEAIKEKNLFDSISLKILTLNQIEISDANECRINIDLLKLGDNY